MSRNDLLEKLAKWRPKDVADTLTVAEDGWNITVSADCVDVVGCRLWELTLRRAAGAQAVDLAGRAGQICQRVTGLLEPLSLVEVDDPRQVALLRSQQPGQFGEERFYYEVLLEGDGGCVVRRFRTPQAGEARRQQVAFTLTHEALAKLVGDLAR